MAKAFSISGQHYLFDVQTFAQVVLATGGDGFHYQLFDRTTQGVMEDVVTGRCDLGVLVKTTENTGELEAELEASGLEFHFLSESAPRIALPASHPMVNADELTLEAMADYPYIYFYQGEDAPVHLHEEALAAIPRSKTIACTDRASLSELIVALNGYTVTSGILVGISDGSLLKTVPLKTDVRLQLGYITRADAQLDAMEARFVEKLSQNLERYAHL